MFYANVHVVHDDKSGWSEKCWVKMLLIHGMFVLMFTAT